MRTVLFDNTFDENILIMKFSIFLLPLLFFLQAGSCGDDTEDDTSSNLNFVVFLGETNEANGGCNVSSNPGSDPSCVYAGSYTSGGLGYAIAISHTGFCRTASFNLRDNLDQPSNAFFVIQETENGVGIETYVGTSGSISLVDDGIIRSMSFSGTVTSLETGSTETIEGFIECPI